MSIEDGFMTVLITMAGLGSRFSHDGYSVPKYRIKARGQSLFSWALRSLSAYRDQAFVLATLGNSEEPWLLHEARQIGINDVCVLSRSAPSRGQAETAIDALANVDPREPLWIYNIDTHVARGMAPEHLVNAQGCLHVFPSQNPGMSFVRYGADGCVVEVAEKKVISAWASVGMYGFANAELFVELYRKGYEEGLITSVGGERYIAPMYQLLLDRRRVVVAPKLDLADINILGTPLQIQLFDPLALPPAGNPDRPRNVGASHCAS